MSESQRELLMIADWLDPSKNPAPPSETWSDTANRLRRLAASLPALPTPLPEGFEDRIRNQAENIVYSVFGFPASAVIGRKSPALAEAITAALLIAHRAATTPMLPTGLTVLLDRMTSDDYIRCSNSMCGDAGWYADGPTDDPEQVQCEFCYTEPRSLFNLKKAIKAIVTTTPLLPIEAPLKLTRDNG